MGDYRRFSSRARATLIADHEDGYQEDDRPVAIPDVSASGSDDYQSNGYQSDDLEEYQSCQSGGSEDYLGSSDDMSYSASSEDDAWGSRPKRKPSKKSNKSKTNTRSAPRKRPVKATGIVSDESEESFDDEGSDEDRPRIKRVVFDGTIPFPSPTSPGKRPCVCPILYLL